MASTSTAQAAPMPGRDCPLCPRLVDFREDNRRQFLDWHNAPVPDFGPATAPLLIVGLAPGLRGANRTGRPFTGDYAGDLLYETLLDFGLAAGRYEQRPDDGLTMTGCRIVNAVRCVPPQNKPTPAEIKTCNAFLRQDLTAMANVKSILALGSIAHDAVLMAFGVRKSAYRFAHAAQHPLPNGIILTDSYHCSRYNTNTNRLTREMFRTAMKLAQAAAQG
ncbi:uracil-DNA glycosylase [Dongia soli]|uniref:Type-5 uracil-DNA glycosylase n=1 Tax=Dongia soli TaxID=600628 RepID=A0ABU5ECU7_9PROT|nr:uracil-DNA glycosylase [Dongia soli]MDY0884132.1 uracil-DNA glycosylase [Dongia soli]